jgi:hypothetical protein
LFKTESANGKAGGDDRIIGNIGLGARKLTQDNTIMFGINNFYDYDVKDNHLRTSLGAEVRSAVLDFRVNRYIRLRDDYNEENVLDGWDYTLSSQIPHLHWASAFITGYEWEGVLREDVRGKKIGSEMSLTPNVNFEFAFDDKDKEGLEDDWYSKLNFIHPGKEGPTAMDGVSDVPLNSIIILFDLLTLLNNSPDISLFSFHLVALIPSNAVGSFTLPG